MKIFKNQIILISILFTIVDLHDRNFMSAQSKGKAIKQTDHYYPLSTNYKFDTLFDGKNEFITESFGFPLGVPDGKGYYIGKKFWDQYSNLNHLGEDWSGVGEGNSDFGDTIYAIASGYISFSEDLGFTWGGIVGIVHKVENKLSIFENESIVHDTRIIQRGRYRYIESFYAHCNSEIVKKGQWVKKGEPIATMGNSGGRFVTHLHFEMRPNANDEIYNGGYANSPEGFIEPTKFMKAYNR